MEAIETGQKVYEFLRTWSRFEEASKRALSSDDADLNKHSVRAVLARLYEEGKIDDGDLAVLEDALQTRNDIVHRGRPLSSAAAERATKMLMDVIRKVAMPM